MRYYTEKLIELSKINDIKMEIDEKLWRPIDIYYQDGDNQLCKDLVDWKPKYNIDETLKDLLDYWLNKIN
jgi:GDP-4-dehydro-6-deoxy-D-mannose reductase